MEEPRNPPPTRQTHRPENTNVNNQQRTGLSDNKGNGFEGGLRQKNLDESLDDIEEEVSEEFVDTSDAIVMVVQDHSARAEQRKEEYTIRTAEVQKRRDDLAARRLRQELSKKGIR